MKGGGRGGRLIFELGINRKRQKGLLSMLTNLKGPRHQVTLSQIPPSQKERQGVKNSPSLQVCPHTNSSISVAYEPAGNMH